MGDVIYAVCSEIVGEHETKRSMSYHVTRRDARKHFIKLMDDYINHLPDDATVNGKFSIRNAESWLKSTG